MITLRAATAGDAEAISTIFNQGITDRIATLDTALRTAAERRQWLAGRERRHPVIVASNDGGIVGWGSLNRFNPREAYDHVVDFSVYVERSWRGKGIGTQLLDRLIEIARELRYHKMVLTALVYNTSGIALYERAGFSPVGVYHEQGQLDGRWVDVIVMEQLL